MLNNDDIDFIDGINKLLKGNDEAHIVDTRIREIYGEVAEGLKILDMPELERLKLAERIKQREYPLVMRIKILEGLMYGMVLVINKLIKKGESKW